MQKDLLIGKTRSGKIAVTYTGDYSFKLFESVKQLKEYDQTLKTRGIVTASMYHCQSTVSIYEPIDSDIFSNLLKNY